MISEWTWIVPITFKTKVVTSLLLVLMTLKNESNLCVKIDVIEIYIYKCM